MKYLGSFAGCAAVMLAIVFSSWAEEPQKAPSDLKPAPVVFVPPGAPAGGSNVVGVSVGRPSPFSAEISADFIRKVMETSAKIEAAKRLITERQETLYMTNPEIKSARTLMIEGQKEINRILDADKELADLKMSRDILWSTMPAMPKARNPAMLPHMPSNR